MTKVEELIKTAYELMQLQAKFGQQVSELQCDEETPKAQAHMVIAEAISLASSLFEDLKEGNKKFLQEMVEPGTYTYRAFSVAGLEFEGKTYTSKPVKGFELLNKEDPKAWAHVLLAAARNNPEVIQKRITDSKVTEQFLKDCDGMIAVKETGEHTWSITKAK